MPKINDQRPISQSIDHTILFYLSQVFCPSHCSEEPPTMQVVYSGGSNTPTPSPRLQRKTGYGRPVMPGYMTHVHPQVLVQRSREKLTEGDITLRDSIPAMSKGVAVTCLVLNIILPGSGTTPHVVDTPPPTHTHIFIRVKRYQRVPDGANYFFKIYYKGWERFFVTCVRTTDKKHVISLYFSFSCSKCKHFYTLLMSICITKK